MTTPLFTIEPIRFVTAAPDSKKNRGQVIRFGNRFSYRPNPVALEQEKRLREYLAFELVGADLPYFGDRDVRVNLKHHVRRDEVEVWVEDLGPRAKGFSGRRRDLANLSEVILDAMQGPVYANDNQVCEIRLWRELGGS